MFKTTCVCCCLGGALLLIGCASAAPEDDQSDAEVSHSYLTSQAQTTDQSSDSYSFFVMSDVHGVSGNESTIEKAIAQMKGIDEHAIAGIVSGDLTNYGDSEWDIHNRLVDKFFDRAATDFDGTKPRYLSALGNHDVFDYGSNDQKPWIDSWNDSLTGQSGLGTNSGTSGIYFATSYRNSLFVMLDSEHPSSDQNQALETALTSSTADFKFLFWHRPVFPCYDDPHKEPFEAGLPWVDLAETHGVDVVFNGHTHIYTRTCPKENGICGDSGVVYVETGSLGTSRHRGPNVSTMTTTGTYTDPNGQVFTETYYNCDERSDSNPNGHLDSKLGNPTNTFCHVRVEGSNGYVDCYEVGNSAPIDSWEITK
ncbi:metallophosphoesterase family protein [Myxococcota bacterium]